MAKIKTLNSLFYLTLFIRINLVKISASYINLNNTCPSECKCPSEERNAMCIAENLSTICNNRYPGILTLDVWLKHFSGISKKITNFPHLEELHIICKENNPSQLIQLNFALSSIKQLHLDNCVLDRLNNDVFIAFPNIAMLMLSKTTIENLNTSLWSSSLKELYLDNNKIKCLSPHWITNLHSLTILKLNDNRGLKQFNASSKSLQHLDLSNCNLDSFPAGYFPKLNELNLNDNNVQILRKNSFLHVPLLKRLSISFNAIKYIQPIFFIELNFLSILDLSYNRLTYLDANTFKNNENLIELYISHNYLNTIENFVSNSLRVLDASFCEIRGIGQASIAKHLPALRELYLTRNRISVLPDDLNSTYLEKLDVRYNYISHVSRKTFRLLKSLRFLHLSGNKLFNVIPQYFPQVTKIYLDENPWQCDCTLLKTLYFWLTEGERIETSKNLFCQSPEKYEGETWEHACRYEWNKRQYELHYVWHILIFVCSGLFLVILIYLSQRFANVKEEELETYATTRINRRDMVESNIQIEIQSLNNHENTSVPDLREHEDPPSYSEAISMPRLNLSNLSLALVGRS